MPANADDLNAEVHHRSRSGRNFIYLIVSFICAVILTLAIRENDFTDSQDYVLFLLFFSVGLWLTEAVPPFAVGLFIIAFLVFSLGNEHFNDQPQNISKYVHTFSNGIIWLMLGGFFLAEAMTKTGVDVFFLRFTMRLSGIIPKNILLGLMLTTMAASMVLSNTATTSMVIASIMPLLKTLGKNSFSKALLVGIPLAASVGGMGTIIGSPTNAIAVGALEDKGITLSFLKWLNFGVPLAIILTLVGWYLLIKIYRIDKKSIVIELPNQNDLTGKDLSKQRRIVLIILMVTILLWMTSNIHNLSVSAVAAIPIIFLTMTGILQSGDIRKLPWDTLLLVAGGLSLGLALQETKLLEYFSRHIMDTGATRIVVYLIFAYATMIFSNIMSNTATSTILIPLGIYLMPEHATQVAVIVGLAASTALLLPISTPPNAIAYSTGLIEQKDFLNGGLLVGLLGPLLIVLIVMLVL